MKPYTEPVVGDNFFARKDILATMLKSVEGIQAGYRHNIALVGRGLVGKTSLILHLLNMVKTNRAVAPIYINLRGVNFSEFIDNGVTAFLRQGLRHEKGLNDTAGLEWLINYSREALPRSNELVRRIKKCAAGKNFDEAFARLWDLGPLLNSGTGRFPVVVLDEFERISSFPLRRPFRTLGQKIMVQQKTLFILSSSSTITAKSIISEKLSLLFGGFHTIDIGPFAPEEAKAYIKKMCKGVRISHNLICFLAAFTGGHPLYLNYIIKKINSAREYGAERISAKHLALMIAELTFYPGGVLNQFFRSIPESLHTNCTYAQAYSALKSLLKTSRAPDISNLCRLSGAQVNHILSSLLEMGIISKNGSLFAITDAMFRMWVEIKTRPMNLSFDFIDSGDMINYAKEVEKSIAGFKAERRKAFDEKVVELIGYFKNDRFFIDQRTRILPSLDYLQTQRDACGNIFIITRGRKDWVFAVSGRKVSEEDVCNISTGARRLKPAARIILIASMDIDESAKLLAKQKKMWVWGSEDLRRLSLFYKGYNTLTA